MEDIFNAIPLWARDDFAIRFYAGSAGIFVIVLCFYRAWREYLALRRIDPKEALSPVRRGGRLPSTFKGWTTRAKKDSREAEHKFRALVSGAVNVALLGVGVPTVMLFLLTLYYGWFDPDAIVVIDIATGQAVAEPSILDASVFVGDALVKGLFFDLVEVFQIHVSRIANAPDNYVFSTAVLVYRAAANLFLVFVPFFLYATWKAMKAVEKEIERRTAEKKAELAQRAGNPSAATA